MISRRPRSSRCLRALGVALLILGIGRVPLPRADYHSIRHHDGPGQACRLHEHLLRWHPDAGESVDVAMLHWHWAHPLAPLGHEDEQGPGVRIHAPDWLGGPTSREAATSWAPSPSPSLVDRPDAPSPPVAPAPVPADARSSWASLRAGPRPARAFGATFAPGISRNALLQVWTC